MSFAAQLIGVDKSFLDGTKQVEVLQGLDFSVSKGESVAVLGPSGSGKSTMLNVIAGLVPIDAGEVWLSIDGNKLPLHESDERQRTRIRRSHIGFVHQFYNLVPTLTVLENVQLPAFLNRRKDLYPHAADLLDQFGLADRGRAFPEVLSGGEQQRVAVARALLMQPPILLADEPTGNLDATNAAEVADVLYSTASQLGVALVLATHSEAVAQLAQRRVMLAGREPSESGLSRSGPGEQP